MSFDLTHRDECETSGPWRLVRRTLGLSSFGMNLVDIPPGETKQIDANAPPGTYEYYCNIPGHNAAGMLGTLTAL